MIVSRRTSGRGAGVWIIIAAIALLQLVAVLVLALIVRHNGWLYYQGGDETHLYTAAWAIANGHIPESQVGYGWPYLLAPIAAAAGANVIAALPAIVVLQVGLLLPVAVFCVYGITAAIGGRHVGLLAAALWVTVPFAAVPLWAESYREKYTELFLPQALGLTALADFASMVCLLAAGLFCVRSVDTNETVDAVAAGLLTGLAIGIKPANALFLAGPALLFVAGRHLRALALFVAAVSPSLLALALWKYRGLGNLPVLTPSPRAVAYGFGAPTPLSDLVLDRYIDLDWRRLRQNHADLAGVLRGLIVWQIFPLLGLAGAIMRAPPKALLLAGWAGAFIVVKGTSAQGSIDDTTLLRLFMPGWPALLMLAAVTPLMFARPRPITPVHHPSLGPAVVGASVLFAALPVALFAGLNPLRTNDAVKYFAENVMVPVDHHFRLKVERRGERAVLAWRPPRGRNARVFYRVFRARPTAAAPDPVLPPSRLGIRCLRESITGYAGASDCRLEMTVIGLTRSPRFVDEAGRDTWVYRIGTAANWRDDPQSGDVLLLSRPGLLEHSPAP